MRNISGKIKNNLIYHLYEVLYKQTRDQYNDNIIRVTRASIDDVITVNRMEIYIQLQDDHA